MPLDGIARRQGSRGRSPPDWPGGPVGHPIDSDATAKSCARLARRRGVSVLRVGPALVEVPPFRVGLPLLSQQVLADYQPDGSVGPGSMESAFVQGSPSGDSASRLIGERIGGCYWAPAPAPALLAEAGAGLAIVVAADDDAVSRAMILAAFARVGAARTLLLTGNGARPELVRWASHAGCRVASGRFDPWPLIDAAAELHVAGAVRIALLAMLSGVAVHCHRPIWFSGRGLTADHGAVAAAPVRTLGALAAAALEGGARYRDPFTAQPCEAGRALDLAAEWRRVCDANRGVAACVGMQFWKRRRMAQFLHDGTRAPRFFRAASPAVAAARQAGGAVAGWASRLPAPFLAEAAASGVLVIRVEDGFLRSVGLGSDFLPPCSVVLDRSGLYYDPAQPSDLETLLATVVFPPRLLARAAALIERIADRGLTKYNTGCASLPALPAGRETILVPGQVADDLSVTLGGGAASGNADLLRRVRAGNPGAFIIYRPHPDVDAGHRRGAIPDAEALRHADIVSRGVPMGALIGAVQTLHVMTSLAGFEALLRGRRVVVWGRPFYAGWGLTEDMATVPRRTRQLQLDELAAGVLLLYPRYVDPVTGLPCPAEVLADRLGAPELWRAGPLVRARRWQGRLAAHWRNLGSRRSA